MLSKAGKDNSTELHEEAHGLLQKTLTDHKDLKSGYIFRREDLVFYSGVCKFY